MEAMRVSDNIDTLKAFCALQFANKKLSPVRVGVEKTFFSVRTDGGKNVVFSATGDMSDMLCRITDKESNLINVKARFSPDNSSIQLDMGPLGEDSISLRPLA